MGGDNDEDWCAPSVTQKFDDDDEEEVLVEQEESNKVDTDTDIERDESVFRADTGSATTPATKEVKGKTTATATPTPVLPAPAASLLLLTTLVNISNNKQPQHRC